MTDYTKATGSTGTMMIRDTGSTVEFWLKAGASTWTADLPWAYVANGAQSAWMSYYFQSGGAWQKLGQINIATSQNVTFKIGASGTAGLGGPTDFTVYIKRSSAPDPPATPHISNIDDTSMYVTFTDGDNNGAAIDSRQIGWGTSSTGPQHYTTSDGSTTIGGLSPGTTYYFWARTHNAEGWSGWSGRASAKTLSVPGAPSPVTFSNVKQDAVDVTFTVPNNGGTAILEQQIGYGLTSTSIDNTIASDGSTTVTGLDPGQTYYFWARARNSIGWSAWSPVRSQQLIAGAWVKVGTTWKRAIPYVNVGGTWKMAQGWTKSVGTWKKTA